MLSYFDSFALGFLSIECSSPNIFMVGSLQCLHSDAAYSERSFLDTPPKIVLSPPNTVPCFIFLVFITKEYFIHLIHLYYLSLPLAGKCPVFTLFTAAFPAHGTVLNI